MKQNQDFRLSQWDLKNEDVTFSKKMFHRFFKLSVWLLARNRDDIYPSLRKLVSRIERLLGFSGPSFTVLYLKEAYRLTTKTLAGERPQPDLKVRVAMRRGLPLIIPGDLRLLIEVKDLVVIKVVLTIISVFRVIPAFPKLKLGTITDPFKGNQSTLPEIVLVLPWLKRLIGRNPGLDYFNMERTPFTVARKLLRLASSGPNQKRQVVGYPLDALAFKENPTLLKWYKVFAMNTNHKALWEGLEAEMSYWDSDDSTVTAWSGGYKDVHYPTKTPTIGSLKTVWKFGSPDSRLDLGRLALKKEAAGKVRVFAIVDAWTQSLLSPLHNALFQILSAIPQDGTFDQLRPVKVLMDKGLKEMYSFDLSAATDRLPIDLQTQILSLLWNNEETAEAWKRLLIDRDYTLSNQEFPKASGKYRYEVGQPMGALSSWAMLALTHHLIVQIAALRVGHKGWFEDYAVLGDDIVIANKSVAQAYLFLMEWLGVDINLSKSVISDIGGCEFAKKIIVNGVDYSPIGVKELFRLLASPQRFKDTVLNNNILGIALGTVSEPAVISEYLKGLVESGPTFSNQKWLDRVRATLWDLLGYFGLKLTMGLSPIINDQAIDSLNSEDRVLLDSTLRRVLEDQVARGWLGAFEKDVDGYKKLVRELTSWYCYHFPSTQALLDQYSADMGKHLYRRHADFMKLDLEGLLELAFLDQSFIADPFTKLKTTSSKSKSLEISRNLLKEMARTSPHLLVKVLRNSQAFSS